MSTTPNTATIDTTAPKETMAKPDIEPTVATETLSKRNVVKTHISKHNVSKEAVAQLILDNELPSNTLLMLGLEDNLYFSMSYQSLRIQKKGFLAQIQKTKVELDVDIACALYDENKELIDLVWYKKLRDSSEAIRHHGDELQGKKVSLPNTTTASESKETKKNKKTSNDDDKSTSHSVATDDGKIEKNAKLKKAKGEKYSYETPIRSELETIYLDLANLPDDVFHIALFVSTFQQYPMNKINEGMVSLSDVEGNSALYVDFSNMPAGCSSLWLASLERYSTTYLSQGKEFTASTWQLLNKEIPLSSQVIDEQAKKIWSI